MHVYIILIEIRTDMVSQLKTKKYYPKKSLLKKQKDVQKLHEKILNANQSKNENKDINNETQRWKNIILLILIII